MELQARVGAQADEEEVLRQGDRRAARRSIGGYDAQMQAIEQRLALFSEELKDKKALLDRQLARKTEVMALRRAEADLSGTRGELLGRIADFKERIARAEQQIAELRSTAMQKSVEELRQTETELDDVREQIGAGRDVLERVDVRAPERGIVVRLNYHARGAVVAPGAVILELLPVNEELVIEGRVNPTDISHVQGGPGRARAADGAQPTIDARDRRQGRLRLSRRDCRAGAAAAAGDGRVRAALVHRARKARRGRPAPQARQVSPHARHAGRHLHQDRRAHFFRVHAAGRCSTASRALSASIERRGRDPARNAFRTGTCAVECCAD